MSAQISLGIDSGNPLVINVDIEELNDELLTSIIKFMRENLTAGHNILVINARNLGENGVEQVFQLLTQSTQVNQMRNPILLKNIYILVHHHPRIFEMQIALNMLEEVRVTFFSEGEKIGDEIRKVKPDFDLYW